MYSTRKVLSLSGNRFSCKSQRVVNKCFSIRNASSLPSIEELSDAKVIYSVAASMGHNQESHPESNLRVPSITTTLAEMKLTPKFRGSEIVKLEGFEPASVDDIASVHARAGIEKVMGQASKKGLIEIDEAPTYVTPTTFKESRVAAGAGLALVDSVVAASKIKSDPPTGFALIRPPGHHAIPQESMGFCIFANVAIAARYAQRVHGLKRVFIIDFDVHHGNGTSDVFYDDPDVFFLSFHQDGSYPGTGKFSEVGTGDGEGTTLNLPLPEGSGDAAVRTVLGEVVVPCAQKFKPDIILVSAGIPSIYNWNTSHACIRYQATCKRFMRGSMCVFPGRRIQSPVSLILGG